MVGEIFPPFFHRWGEKVRETMRDQRQHYIPHWTTLLESIEAGLAGDGAKVRAYTELLVERLESGGDSQHAAQVRRCLERSEQPGKTTLEHGDTIYTCLTCEQTEIRKVGLIYTANVPTHCGFVMKAEMVE